ncbi:putative lipid II flippase FtsW [Magnetovirga frankeli]|uniref:putative lipid II flippase FtsW n=1 Tax=Magnetovirga frankeli TaxID=947516 RepID=UPI001293CE70|nr:putative lipid II flippase FtsW [gamma proteobacterium SS-5]
MSSANSSQAFSPSQAISVRLSSLPAMDYILLLTLLGLLALGLVMVTSASLHRSGTNPLFYMNRHLLALALGLVAAYLTLQIPLRHLQRFGTWLYVIGLALLVLVLIPGVGREVNGAVRWISLGPINFQGSEFMKLFMVIYVASYIVRREREVVHTLGGALKPMLLVAIACVLLLMQPDFGTVAVLVMTVLGMLFLGGVPVWQFAILVGGVVAAGLFLVVFEPYRLARVTSFLDPWADPLNSGFQLTQALIAFGRGEWLGVGLGAGIQKLYYLPEAHTDFILAVIGEELGLLGTLSVIGLFGLVIWRAFVIAIQAQQRGRRFAANLAYGFALWVFVQAAINIGVNIGLFPTKGLTLPFISYGSNSILAACVFAALLLRVDWENRHLSDEEARWQGS